MSVEPLVADAGGDWIERKIQKLTEYQIYDYFFQLNNFTEVYQFRRQ